MIFYAILRISIVTYFLVKELAKEHKKHSICGTKLNSRTFNKMQKILNYISKFKNLKINKLLQTKNT